MADYRFSGSFDEDSDDDTGCSFGAEHSVFDVFDTYHPDAHERIGDEPVSTEKDEVAGAEILTLLFRATNPPDTVSVTTLLTGQVHRVHLSPDVVAMTEAELAQEIEVLSALAARQALAGQHVLISASLRRSGYDGSATRSYLEHQLGLPSPELVEAERANLFASRYADEV